MKIPAILAILILGANLASAADKTLTMAQARAEYNAADAELNKAYKAALAELDKAAAAKLRGDERDWIAYRDQMVEGDFNPDAGDPKGSADYWQELTEYTRDRTTFLRAYSGRHVPSGIAGEYNDSYGSDLNLTQTKGGIDFDLSAVRGHGHNQGEISGPLVFKGGMAHFTQKLDQGDEGPPCELTFTLIAGHIVEVKQKGQDSQAGMGVYYDGAYYKIGPARKPE